jgi:hypothetical protein
MILIDVDPGPEESAMVTFDSEAARGVGALKGSNEAILMGPRSTMRSMHL